MEADLQIKNGSTADQIFGVRKTISLLSRGVTLMPGDVIFTGTPEGVGMGRKPQVWLKDGDVVEVGLENVGTWYVNQASLENPWMRCYQDDANPRHLCHFDIAPTRWSLRLQKLRSRGVVCDAARPFRY